MSGPSQELPTLQKLPLSLTPKPPQMATLKPPQMSTPKPSPPQTSTPKPTLTSTPKVPLLLTSTPTSSLKLTPMLLPMSKPLAAGQPVPKLNSYNVRKFESAQMSAPNLSPKLVPRQPENKNVDDHIEPWDGELAELSRQTY